MDRHGAARKMSPSTVLEPQPPDGYRISLVRTRGDKGGSYEVFTEGWLRNGRGWGRLVHLQAMPNGSLLVSDDKTGEIYRISYRKQV